MVLINRDTLNFLLFDWLGEDREHEPILELSEALARDHFLPHFKAADREEAYLASDGKVVMHPDMAAAMVAYREAGLFALSFPENLGVLVCPPLSARRPACSLLLPIPPPLALRC